MAINLKWVVNELYAILNESFTAVRLGYLYSRQSKNDWTAWLGIPSLSTYRAFIMMPDKVNLFFFWPTLWRKRPSNRLVFNWLSNHLFLPHYKRRTCQAKMGRLSNQRFLRVKSSRYFHDSPAFVVSSTSKTFCLVFRINVLCFL